MDWSAVLRPFFQSNSLSFGPVNLADLQNIAKAIIKNESHFMDHEDARSQFYVVVATIAADQISTQICNPVTQLQFGTFSEASTIIIKFILEKLDKVADSARCFLLLALKYLCGVKGGLPVADQTVLLSMLKSIAPPEMPKGNNLGTEKESPKSESKRSRFDLSSAIMQQLINPLDMTGTMSWAPLSEDPSDCSEYFFKLNRTFLYEINAMDKILNLCTNLPTLAKYKAKLDECVSQGRPLQLPTTAPEAYNVKYSLHQMVLDISLLSTALSLPIIEPLSSERIVQLTNCAMSALYCGITVSVYGGVINTSSTGKTAASQGASQPPPPTFSKEQLPADGSDPMEELSRQAVNKALDVFRTVGTLFKQSVHGYIYRNLCGMGVWMMVSGIQAAISVAGLVPSKSLATDDAKSKSPSRNAGEQQQPGTSGRMNFFKIQQNFGVLNNAIANQCLSFWIELIDDLKMESRSGSDLQSVVEPVGFDVLEHYSALQCVARILNSTSLPQLFTFLATVSYRKATSLRRANSKNLADDEAVSYTDSTTYFNETIICSEDSETEEDDSDSYLGLWFKETLSPESKEDPVDKHAADTRNENGLTVVAAKDEPHEYLELSAQIFSVLDICLSCNQKFLRGYMKNGLTEHQIVLLANILKDLDRDSTRIESDVLNCTRWQAALEKFSGSLCRYLHNLICNEIISEALQSSLLLHLGVSPWTYDLNVWPLQVYPRTLSVLVQIILMKPLQEKEAACLSVWHRLINTLVEGVCLPKTDGDCEDLNVEHAQLLLYLFHSLNLMQKKSILLLTAGGVIRCAEVCRTVTSEKPIADNQVILLSRLLLLLEYLMKHLYNAPNTLLEQVRFNLFNAISSPGQKFQTDINKKTKMMTYSKKDLEDKHKKWNAEANRCIRPRFYSLTVTDNKLQQDFKLDGLAWNFILCTPDKLKYQLLVDSLIDILGVLDVCNPSTSYSTLSVAYYCFGLAWKLLLGLPPSTQHVEALITERVPDLHSLMWSIRCQYVSQEYLIENSLVKQGMYTEDAKALWKKVSNHVLQLRFCLMQTIQGLTSFTQSFQYQTVKLSKVVLVDTLITRINLVLEQEIKKKKTEVSAITAADTVENIRQKSQMPDMAMEGLFNDLLVNLMDTIELLRDSLFHQSLNVLNDRANSNLLHSILKIANAENQFCPELAVHLLHFLSGQDVDVNVWAVELKMCNDGGMPPNGQQLVEYHALQVVDAHLAEIIGSIHLSTHPFLAHPFKSTLTALNSVLEDKRVTLDEATTSRILDIIIPLQFDVRTEFVFKVISKTIELILGDDKQSDNYRLLCYKYVLQQSYKFVIDASDLCSASAVSCPDESVLCLIFKFWESMLEKPMGAKALYNFFCVDKEGSPVALLFSFINSSMSQCYSTKVLQFIEKLFLAAEKKSSVFKMDKLCESVSELATVDSTKLKLWLSHILLGPNGGAHTNSANSSNVQTPTNVTTVVGPGASTSKSTKSDAIELDIEYESEEPLQSALAEIDIDLEFSAVGGTGIWQQHAVQSQRGGGGGGAEATATGAVSATTNRSDFSSAECLEKNGRLLTTLTKYLVSDQTSFGPVAAAFFTALIQIGQSLLGPNQEAMNFCDLLQVMVTLADGHQGSGHAQLFASAIEWLELSRAHVVEKATVKANVRTVVAFENLTTLLKYMSDILQLMGSTGSRMSSPPPWEEDTVPDMDDMLDDELGQDEDDSTIEDSDEDSLGNKLCTFSVTQKEFMNQHWYHCHTCKMVEGVGVCSICARVCHKNHDVSYAKYGNFFCDCGAKEDGTCLALKRRPNHGSASCNNPKNVYPVMLQDGGVSSSSGRAQTSPTLGQSASGKSLATAAAAQSLYMVKSIELAKEQVADVDRWKKVMKFLLEFIESLMPAIKTNCARYSTVGCHKRAKLAMERLQSAEKTFYFNVEVMTPAMGTQESAFENVRISYSGEQGQTIRQLISTNLVRRVTLCCLSSPLGKRQHLAVSLEKGKVLIFQLSILLRQDISKKKLTLNRIASVPINCTILSLAANPANEDYLVVCGLKECHVLTLAANGSMKDHIVLMPQLETGNFIKRAIWLPGSQTQLALVTADFVKIYDLAKDSYSPEYYFLLPNGKIRDCAFMKEEDTYHMFLMASSGYIYTQPLTSQSLAQHGPFYVVETLQLDHPQIKQMNGQLGGGGASIYYSSVLQILFFSFSQGKSFMAPLTSVAAGVKCVTHLQVTASTKSSSKGPPQPLCQWSEIPGHPGVVCSMMQTSNNPVIFMIKPDAVYVQEIKATSAKAKIMDMVAIKHAVYGVDKTTLILLCEDGNLRIHTANPDTTGYWLSPEIQPVENLPVTLSSKTMRRRRAIKDGAAGGLGNAAGGLGAAVDGNGAVGTGNPTFPIDYFEHCVIMNDVEFGGNHMLQVYNSQLLKHRLTTTGLYVASTRINGFTLDVTNNDPQMVITGLRILVGSQSIQRAPMIVSVHGRSISTMTTRPRWFDFPLTWNESLNSDKKLSVTFGPSQDPDDVCMLDSIKVYGKTKDAFGWPKEQEEMGNGAGNGGATMQVNSSGSGNNKSANGLCSDGSSITSLSALDKMISTMLEVLDSGITYIGGIQVDEAIKRKAIEVSTALLIQPTPVCVQNNVKCILASLFGNRAQYHQYKDMEILREANAELEELCVTDNIKEVDPEAYYRLVTMIRGIAVTRPNSLSKICNDNGYDMIPMLLDMMRRLHQVTPTMEEPVPIIKRGLCHLEAIIHSLVDIIYAFAYSQPDQVDTMTEHLSNLLLEKSSAISHSTKQALIKLLQPITKRKKATTPGVATVATVAPVVLPEASSSSSSQEAGTSADHANENLYSQIMQELDPIVNAEDGGEDTLGMPEGVDDEEFLEIAIAMSLQDQEGAENASGEDSLNVQALRGRALQTLQSAGPSHQVSDAMPSTGSDDEASSATTLKTPPPADQLGGSESAGSGVDSTTGDADSAADANQECAGVNSTNEHELSQKVSILRCTILEKMIDKLDKLDNVGGVQAIPFMQVIHLLTMDLDGNSELGQRVMCKLLATFIKKLEMVSSTPASEMRNQTPKTEVQWLILRMFSVFMGKVKSSSSKSSSSAAAADATSGASKSAGSSATTNENVIFFATTTANALMKNGAIPYCLLILESFLPYWTNITNEEDSVGAASSSSNKATNNLLEPSQYGPVPDMMPFYSLQKGSGDPYESYSVLITEIAMKLLYQILKLSSGQPSNYDWNQSICEYMTYVLCEYMMYWQTQSLRRQVRKLLLYICGSKEKYRRMRDIHALNTHMKAVKKSSDPNAVQANGVISSTILSYDALVELTEHLKACQEIATIRTGNWQLFCFIHSDILSSLLKISCQQLDDGISSTILHLLQSAICNLSNGKPIAAVEMNVILRERKDREKSEESVATPTEHKFDPLLCAVLVTQVFAQISGTVLRKFIRNFLLETNSSNLRWQAHSLIYAFYENSAEKNKEQLLEHLWSLWPLLSMYGRRTAQFVDLLGYLTLNTPKNHAKLLYYTQQAVNVLRQQNELLSTHPNAKIYAALAQVLQLDGYYLESELCLVCNNPEVPMNNIKLSSIKIDSKFTTTSTLVKLVYSHTISRINLRIADLKRTKMVKTINIYYNNRTVQAIVELKNRPTMWHKARRINLSSGQTEVKVEFPIPITACNLMIEYADFYESQSGSSENLQCPRCNAAVPANPGVCGNCGENVFQCHKCRAINYDEKDPFLCHSCGFCKYAKFDYTIYGRMCCAVDPIESADDRAKTVQLIYNLLAQADLLYRQLQINREDLEVLLQKNIDDSVELVDLFGLTNATQVHKVIQVLSQKYCVESKASFEDLSKIIQKVQASRKELVAYDRSQMERQPIVVQSSDVESSSQPETAEKPQPHFALNRCFGCALASTEQCLTLLRALASNPVCQAGLCKEGLVDELAHNNLRRGTPQIQSEVRSLLCLLTKDQLEATKGLCALIRKRVSLALNGSVPIANLDIAVHHEMALLMALLANEDSFWEEKLKTVFELFTLAAQDPRGPATVVIQPCLKIVESLLVPPAPISKKNQDMKADQLTTIAAADKVTVSHELWMKNNPLHSYAAWRKRRPQNMATVRNGSGSTTPASSAPNSPNAQSADQKFGSFLEQIKSRCRSEYLTEKYGRRWQQKVLSKDVPMPKLELQPSWLQKIFFNPNSGLVRKMPYNVIDALSGSFAVKRELINLFTTFLKYVGEAGEASDEFMTIYLSIAEKSPWRQYLVLKGVLLTVIEQIGQEIEKIHRLEDTTVSSDLVQGYALHRLVDLLQMFLENEQVLRANKGRLLGPVLQGYLSLRKLVIQRTRLIDEAQEKLLEMLEEMTTGTNEETRDFMAVLIETVDNTPMNDIKTPVFIFERLCSIIHPEENDVEEFFLTLEKDQQQEDFLQGRMLGNPYPSSAPGLGPLMRQIKNKICTDCELVALLEDDNGMELLVNNKIISLDLPVKEIYKKVWLAEGGSRDSMRIVYRMRGLLGDATEEFIETLNNKSQKAVDNEKLYKMANVLAECGGLRVMLERITSLQNVSACRPLLQVLLKLFLLSVKVRRCQTVLCQPDLAGGAINCLLKVLQMCLRSEHGTQAMFTEQLLANCISDLLEIMEVILSRAASETLDSFLQFSLTFGGPEYVQALINCTTAPNIQNNAYVLRHLIRVLAALVYGNDIKMALLCEHFKGAMNFVKFDEEHTPEDEYKMELFCILTNQIEHNAIGGTLKDYIMSLGMVDRALDYISTYAPQVKTTLQRTDSDELKEFMSRPSLKYILRFLAGLCTKHEATQVAVSKDIIPVIHQLEQVSSDEHVGCLAENLLEALCTDAATADRVQQVREFTRAEKKRLAMATREKQLDALGMRTNEKGQVTAKGSILQKIEKLRDETGLTCFICREGYACQPSKVLGIYTFTKRVHVEPYEVKRKTYGYTTVTHFNVVHIECHVAALRTARGRDDWESASLQNANTRCNGLLPLWGPDVSESAFSSCMSRHNLYMQESTQRLEISFNNAIHDLKLLLNRFAFEKSFHEDAGGGGPQSNMHLVPYSLFYALYILLSSRSFSREEKALGAYLTTPPSHKWLDGAYEVEGPLYQLTLSLALHTPLMWQKYRLDHLKRVIALGHVRQVSPNGPPKELAAADRSEKDYLVYKGYLMFWAMIDLIYKKYIKSVTTPKEEDWPISLFDYLRRNDEALQKASEALLPIFSEEYQPCASFAEFCDVAELLTEIEDPQAFLTDLLQALAANAPEAEAVAASSSAN